MNDVAMLVTQNLNLYVASCLNVLFDVDRRVGECHLRLLLSSRKRGKQFVLIVNDAHSSAAASSRCFDDHRISDAGRDARGLLFIFDYSIEARRNGNPN